MQDFVAIVKQHRADLDEVRYVLLICLAYMSCLYVLQLRADLDEVRPR